MALTPSTVNLSPSGRQQFTPYIGNTNDLGITWGIAEGVDGGTITSDGLYTAPLTPGTYHITVTSHADPTKTATAIISVASRVSITPSPASVAPGKTLSFSAAVSGTATSRVTWQLVESDDSGGSITDAGLYTAPTTRGVYHVIATSVDNPAYFGVVTITVASGGAKGGIQ